MTNFFKKTLKFIFNCHQIPERSFFIAGRQFPLCARCTGIFTGILLFPIFLVLKINPPFLFNIFFLIPLILDGSVQLIFCLMSNNPRRFITGLLYSFGFLNIVRSILKSILI